MKTKTLFFQLSQATRKFQSQDWWNYVNAVATNRPARSTATLDAPVLSVGQILNATDRCYIVRPNGSWKRLKPAGENIPAEKSQIRLLPKPDRNKYTREAAQKIRMSA